MGFFPTKREMEAGIILCLGVLSPGWTWYISKSKSSASSCFSGWKKPPLWQKIPCQKGLVLLKNESFCLIEPRTNCFFLEVISSSPNPQTRLFFKVTWKALKAQDSHGAISVECRGDVFSLDVVGWSLLLQMCTLLSSGIFSGVQEIQLESNGNHTLSFRALVKP